MFKQLSPIPQMKTRAASLLFGVCLTLGLAAGARANLVTNGGFENPGAAVPAAGSWSTHGPGNSIPGWTVGPVNVDIHDTGHTTAHSGMYSLDLAGSAPGSISQMLSTVAGSSYLLEFWYAAHSYHPYGGPAEANVSWDGNGVGLLSLPASPSSTNMNWTYFQTTVTATGTDTSLSFEAMTGNGGIILDDISVTAVTPVAAPDVASTLALILLGIGGLRLAAQRE
jgi:choice-of-anchor C domain-containing protein